MRRSGQSAFRSPGPGGFTLVELVVVAAVLVVLASVSSAVISSVRDSGGQVREVNAGRQLAAAFHSAATERNGVYLAGYDRTVSEVVLGDGRSVHGPAANRYPFRLAAYLDTRPEDAILVSRNCKQIKPSDTYSVSLYPSYGINYLFVGGDLSSSGDLTIPNEVVTRASGGANLLLFATAGSIPGTGGETVEGFNILTPPQIYGPMWSASDWSDNPKPNHYGHVHPRHGGRASCVFLDGSVRMLSIEELRDMRLWSHGAAVNGRADYTVTPPTPPRPGRR